jgi:tetratricopeptide (TPR) repeat protein
VQLGLPRHVLVVPVALCGAACLAAGAGPSLAGTTLPEVLQGHAGGSPYQGWDLEVDRAFREQNQHSDYSAEIHYDLGLYFYEQGEFDLSLRHYRKAAEIDPGFPEAYFGIGLLFYTLGDDENAIKFYLRSLECNPRDADTRNNLGLIYYRRGELDLAREQIEEALRLQPRFPDALYNLGLVYYQENRLEVAVRHFQTALTQDPTDVRARFNLGVVYYEMGDLAKAEEQWAKVMESAPDSELALQARDNLTTLRAKR